MPIQVDQALCQSCGICVETCPNEAIRLLDGIPILCNDLCTECGECVQVCPHGAISISAPERLPMLSQPQPLLRRETEASAPSLLQRTIPWVSGALLLLGRQIAENLAGALVSRLEDRSQSSMSIHSGTRFLGPPSKMRTRGGGLQRQRRHGRRLR